MANDCCFELSTDEGRALLQETLELAGIGMLRFGFDGTIRHLDCCAFRLLELSSHFSSPKEVLGRSLTEIFQYILPEDSLRKKVREQGRLQGYEYPLRTLAGREKWLLNNLFTIRDPQSGEEVIQAIAIDITERKIAEKALEEALLRTESMMNNAPIIAIQGFDQDGVVRHWNRASEQLYGLSKAEMTGKRMTGTVFNGEDAAEFERALRGVWSSGQPSAPREWKAFTGDGGTLWIYSSMFPVFQQNAVSEVFRMDVDITERKAAEHDRRNLELQVQHTQRLESLGALAAGVAHEFNNILMGVLGHAELGLLTVNTPVQVEEHFRQIVTATERAAELTKRLLTYSGQAYFQFQLVDISQLVESMKSLLAVTISKKTEITYALAKDLPPLHGDAAQLHQLVLNLVANAAEAIGHAPGAISVRTGATYCDGERIAQASFAEQTHEGKYILLEVSDTGCGMDEPTLSKIFDPFFSTKFIGRGLGLSAAVGIVRAHEGLIFAESKPGQGAKFTVLFPEPGEKREEDHRARFTQGKRMILLVDDEIEIRKVVGEFLEQNGYTVITAADGVEAVREFERFKNALGVVILDLKMPRMDGEETFRLLRQIDPGIRVLLLSGYAEQEATRMFAGKGISGFVQKPCHAQMLLEKIEEVLAGEGGARF